MPLYVNLVLTVFKQKSIVSVKIFLTLFTLCQKHSCPIFYYLWTSLCPQTGSNFFTGNESLWINTIYWYHYVIWRNIILREEIWVLLFFLLYFGFFLFLWFLYFSCFKPFLPSYGKVVFYCPACSGVWTSSSSSSRDVRIHQYRFFHF